MMEKCELCENEVNSIDSNMMCEECVIGVGNPAFLFCSNCQVLWGATPPGHLKYGVILESGKKYNTLTCSRCGDSDTHKVEDVENAKRNLNFSILGMKSSENEYNNSSIYKLYEYIQRLWSEVGVQVHPQTSGEIWATA